VVAIAAWVAVGLVAESRDVVQIVRPSAEGTPASATDSAPAGDVPPGVRREAADRAAVAPPAPKAAGPAAAPDAPRWQAVTLAQIQVAISFSQLPPDDGVVTPMAHRDEEPGPEIVADLDLIRTRLPKWKPGLVTDPIQRVRNVLFVAVAPDLFQMPTERFVPHIVLERLQATIAKDDLIKMLYWIAQYPLEGDDSALDDLHSLGLGNGPSDVDEVRLRTGIYAVKLLGRLIGPSQERPAAGHASLSVATRAPRESGLRD
jgi:hypothetical protein